MDLNLNRSQFFMELPDFVKSIELNKKIKDGLEQHQYFKQFKGPLNSFTTKREKVFYILFVMTRERSTCRKLVELLRETGQTEVADRLEYLNLSKGPMELTMDIEIPILKVTAPKKDLSNCYNLVSNPRGKCIIINNVEDQQTPDVYNEKGEFVYKPKGLKRETERFEYIFKELFFEVQVLRNLNAIKIKQELCEIRKNLKSSEAFVVIVISHGENEQVLGYNACDILRRACFGEIRGNAIQEAKEELERDVINIKDVIKIFDEENCSQLKSVPKLYFFICCRVKSDDSESFKRQKIEDDEFVKVKDPKKLGDGPNLDTFVSYACSEGFQSFYSNDYGMSFFGQAFTHSIAQYACDEPLSGIMSRTSTRLKSMYSDIKFMEENSVKGEANPTTLPLGNFAIEVNTYAMDRQLYFNPGIVENAPIDTFSCNTKSKFSHIKENLYQTISYPKTKSDSSQRISITDYNKRSNYSENKSDYLEQDQDHKQKESDYLGKGPDSYQEASNIKNKTNQFPNDSFSDQNEIQIESPNETKEFLIANRVDLGTGSFGVVYKNEIKGFISEYAIKKIKRKDINSIDNLEKEVGILKICNELFVVKYHEFWSDDRFFYLQMELCTGNLSKVFKEKAKFFNRDPADKMGGIEYFILCEIFKEILECVNYLHELKPKPIIHRDLKPGNILIKENGIEGRFIKLCDFGLATFDEITISQTPNQETTKYIAPEVQQGNEYRIHADIYSLHVIAMEMFEYNRHATGSFITNDERFKEPSTKLEYIIKDMARTDNYRLRPKCSEILETANEWGVYLEQFIGTDEYNEIFNRKDIKLYNFFVNFFQAKRAFNRSK